MPTHDGVETLIATMSGTLMALPAREDTGRTGRRTGLTLLQCMLMLSA